MHLLSIKRKTINVIAMLIATLMAWLTFFLLAWILLHLMRMGLKNFSWHTLIGNTASPGQNGGLWNAIIGSLMMSGYSLLIGGPWGILIGIYLSEYRPDGYFSIILTYVIDILLGSPAIIFGLFIYGFIVVPSGHFSGWAGSLALALIVIPLTAKTTQSIYLMIPSILKEAVFALGASPQKMIGFMIFNVIKGSIISGLLLSFSRILGEAAPLIFTALNNQFLNFNMNKPMANLPILIFNYSMSPYEDWHQLAWNAAFLITIIVLLFNLTCRQLAKVRV